MAPKKALQIHTEESLERGKNMSHEEILRFLEEFRLMYAEQFYQDREEAHFEPLRKTDPKKTNQEKT